MFDDSKGNIGTGIEFFMSVQVKMNDDSLAFGNQRVGNSRQNTITQKNLKQKESVQRLQSPHVMQAIPCRSNRVLERMV
jgi:hypothetical protein